MHSLLNERVGKAKGGRIGLRDRVFAKGGKVGEAALGGTKDKPGRHPRRKNTSRENRLEELGRVDSEKAFSKKGKRNLRGEKRRIVRELKK
jgi:hypothetical protein